MTIQEFIEHLRNYDKSLQLYVIDSDRQLFLAGKPLLVTELVKMPSECPAGSLLIPIDTTY